MRRIIAVVLLVLCANLGFAQNGPETAQHERAVATGLLPVTVIKGQEPPPQSIEQRMAHYKVPGVSVAVVHGGRIEWAHGYGKADPASGRAVTPDTLFQAGSISKPVASIGALQLVEKGKLKLDENVNDFLKSWKVPDNDFTRDTKVTLREIMSHSAGLTVHGFEGYAAGERVPTVVQVLDGVKPANSPAVRVDLVPHTKWRYSGGGFTVMQLMMTDVNGESFPKYLHDSVLKPLAMNDSTYENPLPAGWRARAAVPYSSTGNPISGGAHTYPEMAAAGLWTTASDLARYIIGVQQALAGKSKVLTQAMAQQMLSKQFGQWGLGIALDGEGQAAVFQHGGVDEGFEALLVGFDHTGDGAVVMTNAAGGIRLAQEVMASIARAYQWPGDNFKSRVRELAKLTPEQLARCAGMYDMGHGQTAQVKVAGERLAVTVPNEDDRPLYPASDTVFFTPDTASDLVFHLDAQGNVTGISIREGNTDLVTAKKIK